VTVLGNSYPKVSEDFNELVDVDNVWNVGNANGLLCQQYSAENLENFVFGSLRMYVSFKTSSPGYAKAR
jgi:hypothetical protein